VIYDHGATKVADGKIAQGFPQTVFDLDAALQRGAKILREVPIGLHQGTAMLLILEDPDSEATKA
jgi:hypothetical protein